MKDDHSSKQQFIRMIYDSSNNMSENLGTLGKFLLEKAEEVKSELDKPAEVVAEDELVRKLKLFKLAEDAHNLIWMDYTSWNFLPEVCKESIKSLLDPLFWNGVFFKYDEFVLNEKNIINLIDRSGYLYLLSEHKRNYFLVWVTIDSNHYNWIGESKMIDANKKFMKRLLKSYGIDSEGNLVVKTTRCLENP